MVLQTIRVTTDFGAARLAFDYAFTSGEIPEVTIEDRGATAHAPQILVAVDDGRQLAMLENTGVYTGLELVDGGWEKGPILTRDAIYGFEDSVQSRQSRHAAA